LKQIEGKEDHLAALEKKQAELVVAIQDALSRRSGMFDSVKAEFEREPKIFDQMSFRIEFQYNNDQIAAQSTAFNRSKVGFLVQSRGSDIDIVRAMSDPKGFLEAIWTGKQELNRGKSKEEAAIGVLLTAPEIRFGAELDSDVIGGFGTSTMTPGKQALFALILILSEFQEPWPLLIDQPEDDLDSRSIFETIVPYLAKNKRDRQFIMVSNDANLVIGADSEQVIVANRHATDSPNRDDLTFEYLSGSLEHSQELNSTSPTMLGRFGIREHACEILDGGETAFQKRKEKYKI
jgi:hypothetical protein